MEQLLEYIKENQRNILLILLMILIATLSFGLGYLANREFTRAPIIIEKCADFISEP